MMCLSYYMYHLHKVVMYRINVLCFSLFCSTTGNYCSIKFSFFLTCSCSSSRNFGGKTSLKKTLLGLPFDFKEQSTDGIEIEPSKFEIEVEQIKNWTPCCANRSSLSECLEYTTDIAKLLATERYHAIVRDEKEDSEMKSVGAQLQEEHRVESGEELHTKHAVADQVRLLCFYSETRLFMNDLKRIHTFNAHFIVLT